MKLKRALSLAPLQIAQAAIGFGAIAAFTRLMSAEAFGEYALALSVSMFAHTLVFAWAEAAAFRYFAASKAKGRLADHFATLITLALAMGMAVFVVTAGLLVAVGASAHTAALAVFAAGSAIFRFLTRIARESDRAALDLSRYAIAESLYLVLGFAAGAASLLAFDLGPAAPFAGLLMSGAVVFAFDAPRLLAQAKGGAPSYARAGAYASYGAPLALALAVELGVQALTRIIVADQAGAASLGAYAAAFGLARPIDLIFMSAGAALTPVILSAYEHESADAAKRAASNAFATMAAIALPAAMGLALLAQPLATLLVGRALADEAGRALPWLAVAALFSGFNLHYWSEAFQLTRRTGVRALIMLAPGAVQIAITSWLAAGLGAVGAAIAAAAGAACGGLLLAGVGGRLFAPPLPWPALARIGVACAAMTAGVLAAPPAHNAISLAFAVAAGVAGYAAAAFALDLFGARARASAVWQALAPKLREVLHASFTERFHARR